MLCQGAGTRIACGVPLIETVLCYCVQVFFLSVHSHFAKVLGPGLLVNSPRLCCVLLCAGLFFPVHPYFARCGTRSACVVLSDSPRLFCVLLCAGRTLLVLCCPTHQGCSGFYCVQVILCVVLSDSPRPFCVLLRAGRSLLVMHCLTHQGCSVCYCVQVVLRLCCVV